MSNPPSPRPTGPDPIEARRGLLDAIGFAARAHHGQTRKDGHTPYVVHSFRVCLILRDLFGIDDPEILSAALLHDTIEDTTTDFDDIAERFGARVARWVAALSKDKRLPEAEREAVYADQFAGADWPVLACKLADILDNLLDSGSLSPEGRRRHHLRAVQYLNALAPSLPDRLAAAYMLVRGRIDSDARPGD